MIESLIRSKQSGLTIVYGNFGNGKSEIMHAVTKSLRKQGIIVQYFECSGGKSADNLTKQIHSYVKNDIRSSSGIGPLDHKFISSARIEAHYYQDPSSKDVEMDRNNLKLHVHHMY